MGHGSSGKQTTQPEGFLSTVGGSLTGSFAATFVVVVAATAVVVVDDDAPAAAAAPAPPPAPAPVVTLALLSPATPPPAPPAAPAAPLLLTAFTASSHALPLLVAEGLLDEAFAEELLVPIVDHVSWFTVGCVCWCNNH